MITFNDWVKARESSAFTRTRREAALGLKPPIPGASVHSRSTAHPFEVEKLGDKKGKKSPKKKACKKKKKVCKKRVDENATPDLMAAWLFLSYPEIEEDDQ